MEEKVTETHAREDELREWLQSYHDFYRSSHGGEKLSKAAREGDAVYMAIDKELKELIRLSSPPRSNEKQCSTFLYR